MDVIERATEIGLLAPAHMYPPFRTAAVLGAGTMGAQIAAHLANAGLDVVLLDLPADGEERNALVERALKQTRQTKPAPFFDAEAAGRIRTGNFEDDLGHLADVEWVIEAVVERLDVKQNLHKQIDSVVGSETVVSTNTSGLSIDAVSADCSASFRSRFLGTHFFNPPRYLKLLELVPSRSTDAEVLARVAHFGRIHLGKGIVVAKDTPYFIGNRIGVYALLQAMRFFLDGDYTIEEVDALTGPIAGRPRSATFRTADVVGLDVLLDVARNLYDAVEDDESREAFRPPALLERLVEAGRLGQKSGAGFYNKIDGEIRSVDPETLDYRKAPPVRLPALETIRGLPTLEERLRALYGAEGRTGLFVRSTTLDLLAYSARRIPEIAESPADIDRAMRWGFGWERGPFEKWDVLGFERVLGEIRGEGHPMPEWVDRMRNAGRRAFTRRTDSGKAVYTPASADYEPDARPDDEIRLADVRAGAARELWTSDDAGLLDIGEGVALFEFRSKVNTLGRGVMEALRHAVERVEEDRTLKGMVIANEGSHFSVGANLVELSTAVQEGDVANVERILVDFQNTIQLVRYARKPVVVGVHQRTLGGGCELLMACPHPVASAESYVGLVELGVGLIPAGSGTTRLAETAAQRAPNGHPNEIQAWLRRFFEAVAMSTVSTSAHDAQRLGFLAPNARIVMNEDRRIYVAREEVLRLSHQGYRPPARPSAIRVLGRPTGAAFDVIVQQYLGGRFISDYDAYLARRFAYVLTGGDLTAPQEVDESYLLALEREVFVELVGREKTQDRIEHMLKTKKPLRN